MTAGALRVWRAVDAYFDAHGYMPTQREIWEAMGLKPTPNVAVWLDALENAGKVERLQGKGMGGWRMRGIRLLERPPTVLS